jgi:hypothetical protein
MEIKTIKERYNAEIALLVLCCRVFLKTADNNILVAFIKENNVNWKKVYDLSMTHRIRPLIFKVLFPVKELVAQETFQLFRSYCINFSSRVFSRKAECDKIIQLLQQQGIPARLYKGLDFAALVYKDLGLRESADIDVIIAVEDVKALIAVLKGEGYEMPLEQFYNRFPAQYHQLYKDVCFNKGIFNFEFHYRPAVSTVGTSFCQLLGTDYLSPERKYDHTDYCRLMLINNGVRDYFPTLRSLLDLTFLHTDKPVPELERFHQLSNMLNAQLFNLPANGYILNYTAKFLLKELLSKNEQRKESLLSKTYLSFRFGNTLRLKWNALSGTLWLLVKPNSNDIDAIRLPFYALYYFTKPFRLIQRFISVSFRSEP